MLEMSETSEETKKLTFRWRIASSIIVAVFLILAIFLNVFAASRSEASIRQNVNDLLAERFGHVFEGRDAPITGDRIRFEEDGSSFEFVFVPRARNLVDNASYSGDLIFVVPVTSFSGSSVAVFYYTQALGAHFLGFEAGGEISLGNLKKWSSRIEKKVERFFASSNY